MVERARISELNLKLVRTAEYPFHPSNANDLKPKAAEHRQTDPVADSEPYEFIPIPSPRRHVRAADGSDDALPIFLSNDASPSDPQQSDDRSRQVRRGWLVWAVGNKTSIAVLSASAVAVILLGIRGFSTSPPDATATQTGAPGGIVRSSVELVPKPAKPAQVTQQAAAATPAAAAAVQPPPPSASPVPVSPSAPTREDIVLAYRTALQGQTERSPERSQVASAPPASNAALASNAASAPARLLDKEEVAALLERAQRLMAVSDIASARLLLERAADARDASAAFALASTYDPAVLGRTSSVAPDVAMARHWYEKARSYGFPDAQRRLDRLQKN
jgi:hypothetical protein